MKVVSTIHVYFKNTWDLSIVSLKPIALTMMLNLITLDKIFLNYLEDCKYQLLDSNERHAMSPPLFEFETNGEADKKIFTISFVLLIPDHASSDSE